jgi:outer membrane protein assembly factor BamB
VAALRSGSVAVLAVLAGTHCARSLPGVELECVPGESSGCQVAGSVGTRACGDDGRFGKCTIARTHPPTAGGGGAVIPGSAGSTPGPSGQGGLGGAVGAQPAGEAPRVGCDHGAAHELYVLSGSTVYAIDATTLEALSERGLSLEDQSSLALTDDGTLYVGGWYGDLHTVDPSTGATKVMPFDPGSGATFREGPLVGWADTLPQAPDGALFMSRAYAGSGELYLIDQVDFSYSLLASFQLADFQVVGGEDGRLFALSVDERDRFASILEIDTSDYQVIEELELPGESFWIHAMAYLEGALYVFNTSGDDDDPLSSEVYRVVTGKPLRSQSIQSLGVLPFSVNGAGARLCR